MFLVDNSFRIGKKSVGFWKIKGLILPAKKFYDEFISQSLSQQKIIDALEKYLSEKKLRMYDYDTYVGQFQLYEITKEILQLFKSINNFDSFFEFMFVN